MDTSRDHGHGLSVSRRCWPAWQSVSSRLGCLEEMRSFENGDECIDEDTNSSNSFGAFVYIYIYVFRYISIYIYLFFMRHILQYVDSSNIYACMYHKSERVRWTKFWNIFHMILVPWFWDSYVIRLYVLCCSNVDETNEWIWVNLHRRNHWGQL